MRCNIYLDYSAPVGWTSFLGMLHCSVDSARAKIVDSHHGDLSCEERWRSQADLGPRGSTLLRTNRPRSTRRLCGALGRMMWLGRWAFIWLALASGETRADELNWAPPVAVARVLAGNLLELADGRTVRLAGIRTAPLRPDQGDDHFAQAAQAALEGLIGTHAVRLGTSEAPLDRYGRLVAQVETSQGVWLQGALLEQGLAQLQTRPNEVVRASEMAQLERDARVARRGLWGEPDLSPRDADNVAGQTGSFQVVQGRVVRIAPTDRFVYLNFGKDWRTDFTLRVQRKSFERFGLAEEDLEGRRIEVRGFVLDAGGPLIDVSHPEQIETLP